MEAAHEMIQVEAEKTELAEIQRVEEVKPSIRIRNVAVVRDERIVKMKRIVKGGTKQQDPGKNHAGRDFQREWISPQLHLNCVLYSGHPIIQVCACWMD